MVALQVGFNRRFAPDWRAARDLMDAGGLHAEIAHKGDKAPSGVEDATRRNPRRARLR